MLKSFHNLSQNSGYIVHPLVCFSNVFRLDPPVPTSSNPESLKGALPRNSCHQFFPLLLCANHSQIKGKGQSPHLGSGPAVVTCLIIRMQQKYVMKLPELDHKKLCCFHLGFLEYLLCGKLAAMLEVQLPKTDLVWEMQVSWRSSRWWVTTWRESKAKGTPRHQRCPWRSHL